MVWTGFKSMVAMEIDERNKIKDYKIERSFVFRFSYRGNSSFASLYG